MAFIKLLFVLMILVPVAIVMLFLINRLISDFSESVKKENSESPEERARRKGRKTESYSDSRSYDGYQKSYNDERRYGAEHRQRSDTYGRGSTMEGNPSYEAYRKARSRQEDRINDRSAYMHHSETDRSRSERKKHNSRIEKRSRKTRRNKTHKSNRKD